MPISNLPLASPPRRLLSVKQVRSLLAAAHPEYGREFSDAEWERITERLEALTRLLWDFSQRRAREEHLKGDNLRTGITT